MKWIQIFTVAVLIRIFILAKLKPLINGSFWIFNIVWPVTTSYIDKQYHESTRLSNSEYHHDAKPSPDSLKRGSNIGSVLSEPKKISDILCLKECGHLRSAQISRPGLVMIQEVYRNFPDIKKHHPSISPQLATLIKAWKTLLTIKASLDNPWKAATKWGTSETLIDNSGPGLANVLSSMRISAVTSADVGYKGTQLKLTLTLKGNQTIIFKPKRSKNGAVFDGEVYSGPDRHQGEIAAFHLGLILNMTMVPPVVGRKFSFRREILPVASRSLSKTVFIRGMSTCLYGVCHYCRMEDAVCDEGGFIEGAAILWLPKHLRLATFLNPWARTYDNAKLAKWERNPNFCHSVSVTLEKEGRLSLLLNLIEVSIFDFLIQNGDRHHFSVVSSSANLPHGGAIVILDNGKSFGDPLVDHLDILSPLLQCCRIRRRTLERLELLAGGGLSRAMDQLLGTDSLYPVLSYLHLKAMDRRLSLILAAIRACHQSQGDAIFFY